MKTINKDVGVIIVAAIAVFIGIAFIVGTANTVTLTTSLTTVRNESVSLAGARVGMDINESYGFKLANGCPAATWRNNVISECPVTIIDVENATYSVLNTDNYTANTSSACTASGQLTGDILFKNATIGGYRSNTTYVSYTYCADTYTPGSSNQAVVGLIVLFIVLALLVVVIVYFMRGSLGRLSQTFSRGAKEV